MAVKKEEEKKAGSTKPASKAAVAKKPATARKAAEGKAATKKTVEKKPAEKKPAASKPASKKPAAKKPAAKATAKKPAEKAAAASKPAAKKPATKKPATAKPAAKKPAAKKPATKKPAASKPAAAQEQQAAVIADDMVVAFHYRLCAVGRDGSRSQWLEDSSARSPLLYLHGHGNVVPGLETAMTGRQAGDRVQVTLRPEEAYGLRNPDAIHRVPLKHVTLQKGQKKLVPGLIVTLETNQGRKNAVVVKVGRFNVDIDTNHPYAGRTLYYEIQVMGMRPATLDEIAHGHPHGPGGHQH